jgi:hypothetical protein
MKFLEHKVEDNVRENLVDFQYVNDFLIQDIKGTICERNNW